MITKIQRDLMKHTISGYDRNWFGTTFDSDNAKEFDKLAKIGLVTSSKPPSWMGDDIIYRLTDEGKKELKKAKP